MQRVEGCRRNFVSPLLELGLGPTSVQADRIFGEVFRKRRTLQSTRWYYVGRAMDTRDPVSEQRQLQERYASMTDEEIESVADEAYDLTEIAQESLRAEIRSRRLPIQLRDAPAPSEEQLGSSKLDPSELDLTIVYRAWDMEDARLAKETLNVWNVPSYIGPDNVDNLANFHGSFEHGVEIKVEDADQHRAIAALRTMPRSETEADPEADAVNTVACCPRCRSAEIVFESLDPTADGKSGFDSKFNWTCDACGYKWKDDGIEQEAPSPIES
jgi:hypothetical protein